MKVLFIEYPKCSTCRKAKKWLLDNGIEFIDRNIIEQTPNKYELKEVLEKSGLPTKKLFNTSGNVYKEMNLKDKINDLNEEEMLELLSSNAMLIKRPLVIGDTFALVGFKEESYADILLYILTVLM